MKEIYRLLCLRGDAPWRAVVVAVAAVMCGQGPWARYTLMMQRLDKLPDDK